MRAELAVAAVGTGGRRFPPQLSSAPLASSRYQALQELVLKEDGDEAVIKRLRRRRRGAYRREVRRQQAHRRLPSLLLHSSVPRAPPAAAHVLRCVSLLHLSLSLSLSLSLPLWSYLLSCSLSERCSQRRRGDGARELNLHGRVPDSISTSSGGIWSLMCPWMRVEGPPAAIFLQLNSNLPFWSYTSQER